MKFDKEKVMADIMLIKNEFLEFREAHPDETMDFWYFVFVHRDLSWSRRINIIIHISMHRRNKGLGYVPINWLEAMKVNQDCKGCESRYNCVDGFLDDTCRYALEYMGDL